LNNQRLGQLERAAAINHYESVAKGYKLRAEGSQRASELLAAEKEQISDSRQEV
jgi:hypothetical protein